MLPLLFFVLYNEACHSMIPDEQEFAFFAFLASVIVQFRYILMASSCRATGNNWM